MLTAIEDRENNWGVWFSLNMTSKNAEIRCFLMTSLFPGRLFEYAMSQKNDEKQWEKYNTPFTIV